MYGIDSIINNILIKVLIFAGIIDESDLISHKSFNNQMTSFVL